MMEFDSEFHF